MTKVFADEYFLPTKLSTDEISTDKVFENGGPDGCKMKMILVDLMVLANTMLVKMVFVNKMLAMMNLKNVMVEIMILECWKH